MSGKLAALLLAIIVLLCPARGEAQGKGLELYQRGVKLLKAGALEPALRAFRASYEHQPHNNTVYAIGETLRRLGRLRESHRYYTRYGQQLPAVERDAFARKLERLRSERRSTLTVTTIPSGASVSLDGVARGSTPLRIDLPAGSHRLQVRRDGHLEESRVLSAEFGEPLQVELPLRRRPSPAAPASATLPTRGPSASEQAREPAQSSWSPALRAFVGVALPGYGAERLQLDPALHLELVGGALWRRGSLGIAILASLGYSPILDQVVDRQASLLTFLVGIGGQWFFSRRVWLELDLFLGASLLASADPASFLVQVPGGLVQSYSSFALRPAIRLGAPLWRGMTVYLTPFALSYSPRLGSFDQLAPEIRHLFHLDFALGLGWR